jgi:hypothetical protein
MLIILPAYSIGTAHFRGRLGQWLPNAGSLLKNILLEIYYLPLIIASLQKYSALSS